MSTKRTPMGERDRMGKAFNNISGNSDDSRNINESVTSSETNINDTTNNGGNTNTINDTNNNYNANNSDTIVSNNSTNNNDSANTESNIILQKLNKKDSKKVHKSYYLRPETVKNIEKYSKEIGMDRSLLVDTLLTEAFKKLIVE